MSIRAFLAAERSYCPWRTDLELLESPEFKRRMRRSRNGRLDPIGKSIREEWRRRCTPDGEEYSEYRIFPDNGKTDEEICRWVEEMQIRICSPYDCSGRMFTTGIHWRRVPCGIVVIHEQRLDV